MRAKGRCGCGCGVRTIQLSADPAMIAVKARIVMGRVSRVFSSCGDERGVEAEGVKKIERIKRSLYLAVSSVAARNRMEMIRFIGLKRTSSRIRSFE